MNKEQEKRLWSKVKKTSSCWIWTAGLFPNGYGSISINDKTFKVSRIVYELAFGKFDKKLLVLHKCDNKKCVNPKHLFIGTHKNNMEDMTRKGRQNKGEDRPQSKLKKSQVLFIRKNYSKYSQQELANKFKVSRRLIHNIINLKAWKHI